MLLRYADSGVCELTNQRRGLKETGAKTQGEYIAAALAGMRKLILAVTSK